MRAELEAEAEAVGVGDSSGVWRTWIRWPRRRSSPANVRRVVRALEVAAITGAPFSSFAEPLGALRPLAGAWSAGIAIDAQVARRPNRGSRLRDVRCRVAR